MTNIIFYFSGTGNSLFVAKQIKENLGDTKIVRITSSTINAYKNIEVVRGGIIFPVHAWRPPALVEKFIKSMKFKKISYFFALATHGGNVAYTFKFLTTLVRRIHKIHCNTFAVRMPGNYIIKHSKQNINISDILQRGDKKIILVTKNILNCTEMPVLLRNGSLNWFRTWFIHALYSRIVKFRDTHFFLKGKCISCGICAEVCPVSNIKLQDKPVWQHKCEFCLACVNCCPENVISFITKNKELNYYRHKAISVQDMLTREDP